MIVENQKEDAYSSRLYVTLPPGVSFRNRAGVTSVSETQVFGEGLEQESLVSKVRGGNSVLVVCWVCCPA